MKRIILLFVFVLALSVPTWAQSTNRIILHGSATGAAVGNQPFGLSWNGATITVKGTFTGLTAVAKVSSDGITFSPVSVTNLYGLTASTSITAAGVYFMPVGRSYMFDVEVTALSTGSVDIYATPTDQVLAKGGGGAPSDATFITQTPSSTLTAEQALSALATGLLKNTTATGVLSIAGASDLPSGIDAAKIADASVSNAEFQRLDGVTSGIQTQIDSKQAALGFTPENVANKSIDGTLAGNSDTLYASQKATKTYADTKEVPLIFSSPLVRTVNAVACATCVIASSPGAGIAHFAGSTQTATSSPIVNADITNGTIDLTTKVTGILPGANGGTGVNNGSSTITTGGNVVFSGAFNPTFGIPSSSTWNFPSGGGTLTVASGRIDQNNASTTSTQFFSVISDETGGSGAVVGASNPTLVGATLTGQMVNSTNGAASTPPSLLSGTWFTSGSGTTTKPQLLIEPSGTSSTGWSASGTGLGINAANGFTGNLLDFQVNGASKASVNASGGIRSELAGTTAFIAGSASGGFYVNGRWQLSGPADGVFLIRNDGGTDFGRIQLGGTTSSFPAIKRSSTAIAIRLADDSADAPITAAAGTFSGIISTTATTDSTTTTSGAATIAGGLAVRKRVFIDGITTSSGLQTAVLCQSSGGEMIADSVACLASSGRFKQDIKPLMVGLDEVMRLRPVSYRYKPEGIFSHNANYLRERVGFIAESVATVDERFVGYEADGKTARTVSYETMVPLLVKSIQELKGEVDALRVEIQSLKQQRHIAFHLPSVIGL